MPAPIKWTADQLARMKSAVESGVERRIIAGRFRCSTHTVTGLAGYHGWKIPQQRQAKGPNVTRASVSQSIRRANQRRREEALATLEQRMREAGCRYLVGDYFKLRKAELEERDRAERMLR